MFSECVIICSFDVNSFHSCMKGRNHVHEKGKKESKVFPVHAMEAYGGRRRIAPLILNLGIILRREVNSVSRPISLRKESLHSLNTRPGGS